MRLKLIHGPCEFPHCPAVYLTDRGTLAVQGTGVHAADGVVNAGPDDLLVEVPIDFLRAAFEKLEAASE
ncbi:MAG: hypothetical protein ACREQ5_29520 [Candidatus Dormibacteria bacterium]